MSSKPYSLRPVRHADIPTLAKMMDDSFEKDRHTQVKRLGKNSYVLADIMPDAIRNWLSKPDKCALVKAVDNTSGEIMGWVCWGFNCFEMGEIPILPSDKQAGSTGTHDASSSTLSTVITPDNGSKENSGSATEESRTPSNPEEHSKDSTLGDTDNPISRLEALTDADRDAFISETMPPGKKCMYIASLIVHPRYQSRGVGSSLLQWGTTIADQVGVLCWVHSSEGARGMYVKGGFDEVKKLEVELDEYAPRPPMEGGRWGKYTFYYMVRKPRVEM